MQLGKAEGVPFADRAFVLIANRLIRPSSEHGLAGWLETDFVCDRQGRRFVPRWQQHKRVRVHFQQLEAWYRTSISSQPPRNRSSWPSITASAIVQPQARVGALRHHQHLLRGRRPANFAKPVTAGMASRRTSK